MGRKLYDQRFIGNSPSTYMVYATTKYTYDANGNQTQILQPDGSTKTTFTFDAAGRNTGLTDPDKGTESDSYDVDGNLIQASDGRGSAGGGTVYAGYDGIDRLLWRNTTNSATGAYVTYSYDSTANGNHGVGRKTGESFTGGPNGTLTGSYAYTYDLRGQQIGEIDTIQGTAGHSTTCLQPASPPIRCMPAPSQWPPLATTR